MGMEIERKFLVNTKLLPSGVQGIKIIQGYLHISDQKTIRVRISGELAYITIKGPDKNGVRPEFEYAIPTEDARFMLANFCRNGQIEKIRRKINWAGKTWEIDEFFGENKGLWLAEVELDNRNESLELPVWVSKEVTGDSRFHNSVLSAHPYSSWELEDKKPDNQ